MKHNKNSQIFPVTNFWVNESKNRVNWVKEEYYIQLQGWSKMALMSIKIPQLVMKANGDIIFQFLSRFVKNYLPSLTKIPLMNNQNIQKSFNNYHEKFQNTVEIKLVNLITLLDFAQKYRLSTKEIWS